jgi:toxin ParE1/3/4
VRVKWLRTALRNLEVEAEYIAQENPEAAARVVERVRDAVQKLADHPALGRPGRVSGTRDLVVTGTPYIVPYRVRGNVVEVLRVQHAARKWPEKF